MRGRLIPLALSAALLVLGIQASIVRADGGAVRFSERRGNRLITVFTAPTPLRAGAVDVSVLVQDTDSGTPLPDVPVVVSAEPLHRPQGRISVPATSDAATNKLLRAAPLALPEPGPWHLEVVVQGSDSGPPIAFDVEVAEALPPWRELSPWIGWPVLAIGLFALHQWLVRRAMTRRR